jgi:hypothetical protein
VNEELELEKIKSLGMLVDRLAVDYLLLTEPSFNTRPECV